MSRSTPEDIRPFAALEDPAWAAVEIAAEVLYFVDNTVTTGAASAAFSAALGERWPGVRAVMLALVFRGGATDRLFDGK